MATIKETIGQKITEQHPIAYFCAEFAMTDDLPIYSGGLGILAGDVIRQAEDSGLPLVGVGLLYKQGYFTQVITQSGMQDELPAYHKSESLPVRRLHDAEYNPQKVEIHLGERLVQVQLWVYEHGNTNIILLDTDLEENSELDRRLTLSLYPTDTDWRIQQEIILGIGGVKALRALKIDPSIYHMNEGHSAFAILEVAHHITKEEGIDFNTALKKACEKIVFTNHTLIPSGNDLFHKDQVTRLLDSYATHLGLTIDEIVAMGRLASGSDFFSMTHLALSAAKVSSAVSISHSKFAKTAWPDFPLVPVTNGVHLPTWQDPRFKEIGEKVAKGLEVSEGAMWRAHQDAKERLCERVTVETGKTFDPEVLTIVWSRRIAAYKQPLLLFADIKRLISIVKSQTKPVQILIAGKAHPGDTTAKAMISQLFLLVSENNLGSSVIFLPNYGLELAKYLVAGADVWLNTPEQGKEACGTSGMKAGLNAVLQACISDGWTDELDLDAIGFKISPTDSANSLYEILEKRIVPLYYERNSHGIPVEWVGLMQKTMWAVSAGYTTERMIKDYVEKLYLPVL